MALSAFDKFYKDKDEKASGLDAFFQNLPKQNPAPLAPRRETTPSYTPSTRTSWYLGQKVNDFTRESDKMFNRGKYNVNSWQRMYDDMVSNIDKQANKYDSSYIDALKERLDQQKQKMIPTQLNIPSFRNIGNGYEPSNITLNNQNLFKAPDRPFKETTNFDRLMNLSAEKMRNDQMLQDTAYVAASGQGFEGMRDRDIRAYQNLWAKQQEEYSKKAAAWTPPKKDSTVSYSGSVDLTDYMTDSEIDAFNKSSDKEKYLRDLGIAEGGIELIMGDTTKNVGGGSDFTSRDYTEDQGKMPRQWENTGIYSNASNMANLEMKSRDFQRKYVGYTLDKDFDEKSKYVPEPITKDLTQLEAINPETLAESGGSMDEYNAIRHEAINGNPEAVYYLTHVREAGALNDEYSEDPFVEQYMTQDEIDIYNSLWNDPSTRGQAQEYLDGLNLDLWKRAYYAADEATRARLEKMPGWALLLESGIMAGIGLVENQANALLAAEDILAGRDINPFRMTNYAQTTNEVADTRIRDWAVRNGLGEVGQTAMSILYQGFYSGLQSGMALGFGGLTANALGLLGNGATQMFSLGLMSTGAGTQTLQNELIAGIPQDRALLDAATAGVIEFATEKIGMDNLFNNLLRGRGGFIAYLKQALAEGAEELVGSFSTDAFGKVYDLLENANYSELNRQANAYLLENGLAPSQRNYAMAHILAERLQEYAIDFGTGWASVITGEGSFAAMSNYNNAKILTGHINERMAPDIFRVAMSLDPESKAYKEAETLRNRMETEPEAVTAKTVQKVARDIVYEVRAIENNSERQAKEMDMYEAFGISRFLHPDVQTTTDQPRKTNNPDAGEFTINESVDEAVTAAQDAEQERQDNETIAAVINEATENHPEIDPDEIARRVHNANETGSTEDVAEILTPDQLQAVMDIASRTGAAEAVKAAVDSIAETSEEAPQAEETVTEEPVTEEIAAEEPARQEADTTAFANTLSPKARQLYEQALEEGREKGMDAAEATQAFLEIYTAGTHNAPLAPTVSNRRLSPRLKWAIDAAAKKESSDYTAQLEQQGFAKSAAAGVAQVETSKGLVATPVLTRAIKDGRISQRTADTINKMGQMLGVRINVLSSNPKYNGEYKAQKADINLYLDAQFFSSRTTDDAIMGVLGHELSHRLENVSPEAYRQLTSMVMQTMGNEGFTKWVNRNMQRTPGMTILEAQGEVVSDFVGTQLFRDSDFVDRFLGNVQVETTEQRTALQGLRDFIHNVIDWIRGNKDAFKKPEQTLTYMQKLENTLTNLINQSAEAVRESDNYANETEAPNTRYSTKDSSGNTLTPGQAEYFKDSKVRDKNGSLLVMYHGTDPVKKFTVFTKGKNGYLGPGIYLTDNRNTAKRYATQYGGEGTIYETYVNITNPYYVYSDTPAREILGDKIADRRAAKNSYSSRWMTTKDIQKLIDQGYDGIIWDYNHNGNNIEVSVFDSNQIKNITNQNPTDNPDIRYSVKDSDYMAAVNAGDMETAQRMVDDAAREAGYTIKAYHGTKSAEFTTFDSSLIGKNYDGYNASGGGFDFTTNETRARKWGVKAKGNGEIRVMPVYLKTNKTFYTYNGVVDPELESALPDDMTAEEKRAAMRTGANFHKAIEEHNMDFKRIMLGYGYDSYSMYPGAENISVYMPSQIKSADPVTYDENDNVIPLSERFNTENPDIRYSRKDSEGNTLTEAQAEYFKDSQVRDKDGNLLVVYHGTNAEFNEFSRDFIGSHGSFEGAGFNFTPSETRASGYKGIGGGTERVLSGYLNITSPLSDSKKTMTARQLAKLITQIDPTGDDIIVNYAQDARDYGTNSFIQRESLVAAKLIMQFADSDVDIYSELSAAGANANTIIEAFKSAGYDGLIHHYDDGSIKTLIAFDSNQFKNIDNANPTENPDIRYSIKSWEAKAAIYDSLDHADTGHDNLIRVGTIPKLVSEISGISGDLYVYRNHLYENMVTEKKAQEEGRYNDDGHYHELGEELMEQALLALNTPSIVFSDSQKANPEITMILPVFDKSDAPIHAVMSFYRNTEINGEYTTRPHIAVTFYGHQYDGTVIDRGTKIKGIVELTNEAITDGRILYVEKNIRDNQPVMAKRVPLGNITESSLKKNIARFQNEVNQFKNKNRINYSLKGEQPDDFRSIVERNQQREQTRRFLDASADWRQEQTRLDTYNLRKSTESMLKTYGDKLSKDQKERLVHRINSLAYDVLRKNVDAFEIESKATAIAGDVLFQSAWQVPMANNQDTKASRAVMMNDAQTEEAIDYLTNYILASIMATQTQQGKKLQAEIEKNARLKETLREVRQKRDARIEEEKARRKNKQLKRQDSNLRKTILHRAKRLMDMKMSTQNREKLMKLIGDMNLDVTHLTDGKKEKLLDLLQWATEKELEDPNFWMSDFVKKQLSLLNQSYLDDIIKDGDIDKLILLNDALLELEYAAKNENWLINDMDRRDVREIAYEEDQILNDAPGTKQGIFRKMDSVFVQGVLSPMRFLRRLTGYNEKSALRRAGEAIKNGYIKKLDYMRRASELFDKWMSDRKWTREVTGKKATVLNYDIVTAEGKKATIQLTKGMRMLLYLASKDSGWMRHMCGYDLPDRHVDGRGISLPNMKYYLKGDMKEAYDSMQTYRITKSFLTQLANDMTKEEREFADEANKFFNGMQKNELNAASMDVVGREIAKVDDYLPISVNTDFVAQDYGVIHNDGSVASAGNLQERVNSNAAVVVRDLTDVLLQSIQTTSNYIGLALPIQNFNKIMKASLGYVDDKGNYRAKETTLKNTISQKWGSTAQDYIDKMLRDIQNTAKPGEDLEKAFAKMRSNYARSVLTLNLSVGLKQFASYPTAAAIVGWEPLAKAMKVWEKADIKLINKYTPLLWHRSKGFVNPELGSLKSQNDFWNNLPKGLNWITLIDYATTKTLWKAAEYYVRDNQPGLYKKGAGIYGQTDAYNEAVAEVYNQIIEDTQPNYTPWERPQYLRSDSGLTKTIMMFKTQPMQNFNVLYDAVGNFKAKQRALKANKSDPQVQKEYKEAAKKLRWGITSQIGQLVLFASMTMLWNWFRRKDEKYTDEEGNFNVDKLLTNIGKDIGSGVFGMVPFGSDVWEGISAIAFGDRYYGFESVTDSALGDLGNAVMTAWNAVSDMVTGKKPFDITTYKKKIRSVGAAASKILGIPAENIYNLCTALYKKYRDVTENKYMADYYALAWDEDPSTNKKQFVRVAFQAYMDGDMDSFDAVKQALIEDFGFSEEDDINAKLKELYKEKYAADPDHALMADAYQHLLDLYTTDIDAYEKEYQVMRDLGFTEKAIKDGVNKQIKAAEAAGQTVGEFKAPEAEEETKPATAAKNTPREEQPEYVPKQPMKETPEPSPVPQPYIQQNKETASSLDTTSNTASWQGDAQYNSMFKMLTIPMSGRNYTYYDVPADVWEGMKNASNPTAYYNQYIKGVYRYTRN